MNWTFDLVDPITAPPSLSDLFKQECFKRNILVVREGRIWLENNTIHMFDWLINSRNGTFDLANLANVANTIRNKYMER